MPRRTQFRASLFDLFVFTAVGALSCGALYYSYSIWMILGVQLAVLLSVLLAIVFLFHPDSRQHVFCAAFLLTVGFYFGLCFVGHVFTKLDPPPVAALAGPWSAAHDFPYDWDSLSADQPSPFGLGNIGRLTFVSVGVWVGALLLGLIVAWLARGVHGEESS